MLAPNHSLRRRLSPLRFFERIIAAGYNRDLEDPNAARRASLLNVALVVGVITAVALGSIYFVMSTRLAAFHYVAAGAFGLIYFCHRVTHATTLCGRIGGTFLFLFLAVTCWNLGALHNASIGWFVVVPISAAIVVGTGDAWFWILASVVLACGFLIASHFGIQPANIVTQEYRALANMSFFIALMLVIGTLITTWFAGQRLLQTQLNRALDETEDEAVNARVLASTSTAANEGAAFDTTAQDCMNILCDAFGWEAAHLWISNDDGLVLPTRIVSKDVDPAFAPLFPGADEILGEHARYFPQSVVENGREVIQSDLEGDFRAAAGKSVGLKSVLIWPVIIDGNVDAVLEFFSREAVAVDGRTRQLLHHVALQLGHVRGREVARGRIEQLAYYDIVTGLPNRHAFERRFGVILDAAARRQTRVALMFIDLDGFKYINDSLGHAAGDRLLHTIGEKLSENLRGSDFALKLSPSGSPMVARVGGDEFTVVLQDLAELRGADVVARRFLEIISKPIDIGEHKVVVGASIGIAVYPDDASTRSDLLRLADAAMYEAKRAAGNQYRFATSILNTNAQHRVWLENELRQAIAAGSISAHFQAIVDAQTNETNAFEALARWRHEGIWIDPAEFIQLAEETGIIHELGEQILRQSCHEIERVNRNREAPLRVCVNVSPHQLRHDDFVDKLSNIIAQTQCSARDLVLELTESSLIVDDQTSIDLLGKIRDLGVAIALDDFGTGYASLSHLRNFPLDYVKIDRSFISGPDRNAGDDAIIGAVIAMSHTLNLKVVAEGVETDDQVQRIRALGCDALQGFYFDDPTPQARPT